MVVYEYFEPNEMVKRKSDVRIDCVIRAMCKVFNKKWLEVFDELVVIARKLQEMPNAKIVWKEYLKEKNCTYVPIKVKKGSKRPTVKSFAQNHKEGTYVLSVAHHVVAVKDGKYYDSWDSGSCSLYSYWIVKGNQKEEQKKEIDKILQEEHISPAELLNKLKRNKVMI